MAGWLIANETTNSGFANYQLGVFAQGFAQKSSSWSFRAAELVAFPGEVAKSEQDRLSLHAYAPVPKPVAGVA
jgi:hypothetical protein